MPETRCAIAGKLRPRSRVGDRLRRLHLMCGGRTLRLGRHIHGRVGRLSVLFGDRRRCGSVPPAREDQPGLGDPDLVAERAIAFGRARLTPERCGPRLHIGEQIVEPAEIDLGRAQFLLGILAAYMQPGDARRFLEHLAPLSGLGGDDGRDAPLADERGRMRAGRSVGKHQADILGADIAAIHPIGGTGATFDPAGHLDLAILIRRSVGALGKERDFGEIARGARRGAGEDHVLHPAAA